MWHPEQGSATVRFSSLRPLSVTFPFVMNVGRSDWGVGRRLALFSLLDPLPLRNQQIPGTAFTVCGSY